MRTPLLLSALLGAIASPPALAQIGISVQNQASTTTASYVSVKYHPSLVPQTGITVEAWFTYDESTLGTGWRWPTIARLNPNAAKEAYWLRIDAGQTNTRSLAFGTTTSAGLTRIGYPFAAAEFTKWTHVAATYDGTTARIYINGVLKVSSTQVLGPNLIDQGGDLHIGNGDGNIIENWNGEIDCVRLWPYARSADEIASTMNVELAGVPGVVSCWNLNFTPADSSGTNHGVDVNSPSYGINTNKLTGGTIGATVFGAGTAGCAGTPAIGVSGLATAGNKGFGITCLHAATAGVGFVWVGLARLGSAIPVSKAALWVDPSQPGLLVPALGDTHGLIKLPAPIPTGVPAATKVYGQFFFTDKACSVPISASEGLEIKTL